MFFNTLWDGFSLYPWLFWNFLCRTVWPCLCLTVLGLKVCTTSPNTTIIFQKLSLYCFSIICRIYFGSKKQVNKYLYGISFKVELSIFVKCKLYIYMLVSRKGNFLPLLEMSCFCWLLPFRLKNTFMFRVTAVSEGEAIGLLGGTCVITA